MGEGKRSSWLLGCFAVAAFVIGVSSFTATAQAAITITPVLPQVNGLAAGTLPVQVQVTSTYQLATVTASVGAASTPLTYDNQSAVWYGFVDLTGFASPSPYVLNVNATDVFNASSNASIAFKKDLPPVVTVTSPLEYSVGRPNVHVTVTCADDGGCASLYVNGFAMSLATGTTTIDQDVSLAAWESGYVELYFIGNDGVNPQVLYGRKIYVESSPALVEEAAVSGKILDYSADRILFHDPSGQLVIHDRATSAETVIPVPAAASMEGAALTPAGAIFGNGYGGSVKEWRNGVVQDLGALAYMSLVRDSYALWLPLTGN